MLKRDKSHDAFAVLRIPDYRKMVIARFFITFATQMQATIVGWQVYSHTKDPLSLGLIGLAEAVPFILVSLYSGHIADNYRRKNIISIAVFFYILGAIVLTLFTWELSSVIDCWGIAPIFIVIIFMGLARGFYFPSQSALMAQIVPRELYGNSSTWNSIVWHIAAVSGPAAGGLIYGFAGITAAYITVCVCVITGLIIFLGVTNLPVPAGAGKEAFLKSLSSGLKFVYKNQLILGALSLDMFAVLFGGVVALLPIFASEVLAVGPQGLGFLRAAPMGGAVIMSLILAYYPPQKNAGTNLLWCVAGFGICIILFALSSNFYLSIFLLFISGIFDNVSVIIRGTILQVFTPDHMRGRVSAVNSVFVGSSNEIGSFESGLVAKLLGLIPSVIFGGTMTLMVVGTAAIAAPKLRKLSMKDIR